MWKPKDTRLTSEYQAGRHTILKSLATSQPIDAQDTIVQTILRHLVRYHVIELHNGGYRFEVPFVERWVRERGVIE